MSATVAKGGTERERRIQVSAVLEPLWIRCLLVGVDFGVSCVVSFTAAFSHFYTSV